MFHSSIIHISQKWKQPKCPSTDEWINKMYCIDTMEYYSLIKRSTNMGYNKDDPQKYV